jgi:hypothetical protein
MPALKPETAQAWLCEAQDLVITHQRAAEIVGLIDPIAEFARKAASAIRFDGEPGDFIRTLRAWSLADK